MPNDHVRTIIELLRAGTPDLGRRWLAALLLVPEVDRAALVEAVEARIAEAYGRKAEGPGAPREVSVVSPPVQREGYVEQVHRTYADTRSAEEATPEVKTRARSPKKRA